MQRLFSTFADGWPGGGILLLRLITGGALIQGGIAAIAGGAHLTELLPIAGVVAGCLMLCGLWTPVAGVLAGMVEVWMAFSHSAMQPLPILLAGLSISLAMIGPGTWSIDAQLYGRKRILPPEP